MRKKLKCFKNPEQDIVVDTLEGTVVGTLVSNKYITLCSFMTTRRNFSTLLLYILDKKIFFLQILMFNKSNEQASKT